MLFISLTVVKKGFQSDYSTGLSVCYSDCSQEILSAAVQRYVFFVQKRLSQICIVKCTIKSRLRELVHISKQLILLYHCILRTNAEMA